MQHRHYDLFLEYFGAIIGRFYSPEQRQRLLALLLGSFGIYRDSNEYDCILSAIEDVDSHNIGGIIDSKNYRLLCDILDSDDDKRLAAKALVEIYERIEADRDTPKKSYLDWIISLRAANPKTDEVRMEIAYFEYASGNVDEAVKELKALVNDGSIIAVHHLAFISLERQEHEEAYYYFSLLKSIYTKRLKIPAGQFVDSNIEAARDEITTEALREMESDIEKIGGEFPLTKCKGFVTVGFLSTERRYTYEY